MQVEEAQDRMREIQRIMETATLFTLLPGTASIVGGALVFLGCGASYWLMHSVNFADITRMSISGLVSFFAMWFVIAVAAVLTNVFLTARLARRKQITLNHRPAQVALFALTPCVAVAAAISLRFLLDWQPQEIRYVAPIWILLYGTGVYTAGLFSIRPPRVLGVAFILFGLLALFVFPDLGVLSVALSFGLLHVLFGAYVLSKRSQAEAP